MFCFAHCIWTFVVVALFWLSSIVQTWFLFFLVTLSHLFLMWSFASLLVKRRHSSIASVWMERPGIPSLVVWIVSRSTLTRIPKAKITLRCLKGMRWETVQALGLTLFFILQMATTSEATIATAVAAPTMVNGREPSSSFSEPMKKPMATRMLSEKKRWEWYVAKICWLLPISNFEIAFKYKLYVL